ncbi:SDR family oxidoreductase [Streptomyces sp. CAU 1734]|uniref:SDR family oxidoreductase n=1 Tax=Streptomyces sp. CAU 1734 TaxID=3140360 RepID=UPI003260262F
MSVTLPGARERWVRTGGIELCVAELGDSSHPTVVLVHGYPDSKEVWSEVAGRLAERFHVVLYDVRGHGGSSAPKPLRGGFTLEKLTDDFLAVADAVSPDRPVHLVGHDWGSVQSWEFVTVGRTEGRIASFTSISGPSLDHFGHWIKKRISRPTPGRVGQLLGQGARSWYVFLLHTPRLPELAWHGPLGRWWPGMLERTERVPRGGYPTPTLARDAAHGAWLYRDNVRARMSRPRPDARAHVPVQLITPTGDVFLSEHLYDDLGDWAPRLTRRSLAGRHWVPRTRPDQVSAWIAGFVTAHEDGPAGSAPVAPTAAGTAPASAESGSTEPLGTEPPGSAPASTAPGSTPPARTAVPDRAAGGVAPAIRAGGRRAAARRARAERFGGRLVLVTGAASGIGRATALAFAEAGARIVAVDLDGGGAARTADTARLIGAPEAWGEQVDVGDAEAMEKLSEKVAGAQGVVDVLVNNAGIGLSGPFMATTAEEWQRVLDVNLWGVIHGCRLFGRQMAERGQGGHIVNTASGAAYQPTKVLPAYSTSKAAVLMLSECLRAELAGQEIGVSAICPGIVRTNITATTRFAGTDEAEERRLRQRAGRLYGLRNYPPEKVADAILDAVLHNRAVVPVTPEARGALLLSRFAPRALRAFARLDPPM